MDFILYWPWLFCFFSLLWQKNIFKHDYGLLSTDYSLLWYVLCLCLLVWFFAYFFFTLNNDFVLSNWLVKVSLQYISKQSLSNFVGLLCCCVTKWVTKANWFWYYWVFLENVIKFYNPLQIVYLEFKSGNYFLNLWKLLHCLT